MSQLSNWVKDPPATPTRLVRDGREVDAIAPALRSALTTEAAAVLAANANRAFQGPIPRSRGFVLEAPLAEKLLAQDPRYEAVVRPYLIGDDIAKRHDQSPSRFIIDFGTMTLEEASAYPEALNAVRLLIKPDRDLDPVYENIWWLLWRPRPHMRRALEGLPRYVGGTATGKRILFCWCDPWTLPSNAMNVFAFHKDHQIWCSDVASSHRVGAKPIVNA